MKKWLLSYRYNDISCAHARGHALPRENFWKKCAIWWVLVYICIRFFLSDIFV